MTTVGLAMDFTALLKMGQHAEAAAKYNDPNIVSFEAMEGPMAVCTGLAAVKAKGEWFNASHEIHGGTVEGPFVNGDSFVVRFTMDVTVKETGVRMTMDEVGIYKVAGGKIISETFCYAQG